MFRSLQNIPNNKDFSWKDPVKSFMEDFFG